MAEKNMSSPDKLDKLMELLSDPYIYDLATALRGPDSGNRALKSIFTARIRALVGIKPGIVPVRESNKVRFDDIIHALLTVSSVDEHYLDHVKLAIGALHALLESADKIELRFLEELSYLFGLLIEDNEESQVYAIDRLAKVLTKYSYYIHSPTGEGEHVRENKGGDH